MLQLLHRDEGLTGRLNLWNAVLLAISKRLWLGYGFNAFWQGMKGESGYVLTAVGWAPKYAHNGFLDLVLDLGLLGLLVFAIGYLSVLAAGDYFCHESAEPCGDMAVHLSGIHTLL